MGRRDSDASHVFLDPVNASSLLGSAAWTEEGLYLKDFVQKYRLPKVVRVVKGQYLGVLGAPSVATTVSSQHCLLISLGRRRKLLAQGVKFKDGKITATGSKVAIPEDYCGYFELLNEDGQAVRCVESVQELCKRLPDSILVRKDLKCFVSESDEVDGIGERSRVVSAGETLVAIGDVVLVRGENEERFLRCLDSRGENVYLSHDLKGCSFSPVAKESNISGVHSAKNLLNKRTPFMARLVEGQAPSQVAPDATAYKMHSGSSFVPELRMLTVLDEESLFALVLDRDSKQALPLPLTALLRVETASNCDEISSRSEFPVLVERCRYLAARTEDAIAPHDVSFKKDIRLNGNPDNANSELDNQNRRRNQRARKLLLQHHQVFRVDTTREDKSGGGGVCRDEYDEIEQIYDYVRGFAPLPKSAKGWKYDVKTRKDEAAPRKGTEAPVEREEPPRPPKPPPIETMPQGPPPTMVLSPPPPAVAPTQQPTAQPTAGHSMPVDLAYCATPSITPGPGDSGLGHWDYLKSADPPNEPSSRGKSANSKKRQRRVSSSNLRQNSENLYVGNPDATTTKRHDIGGGTPRRFFKLHQQGGRQKDQLRYQSSLNLSKASLHSRPPPPAGSASFMRHRHKSLNNLAAACEGSSSVVTAATTAFDGSQNSGDFGKAATLSGDSGSSSRALPQKKSRRRLSRPRSLTNLMMESKGGGSVRRPSIAATASPSAHHREKRFDFESGGCGGEEQISSPSPVVTAANEGVGFQQGRTKKQHGPRSARRRQTSLYL